MPSAVRALVADKQVSSAGAGWLVQALDPFHDVQRIPSGYPDTTVGASFVEVVKLVQNFTVPAPGFAMDLHVYITTAWSAGDVEHSTRLTNPDW